MPTVRLTDARIKALKSNKSTRDVRDAALKGFGVRILPSGRRRFFIHTQFDGKRIWKIIGDPSMMTLAEARDSARAVLVAIRKGQPAAASPSETLFEVVAEEVFRRYSRHWKSSTLRVNRGYLRKQILPRFRGRQIADIALEGCPGLVFVPACDACRRRPLGTGAVRHHVPGRGLRLSSRKQQSVHGYQTLPAERPGTVSCPTSSFAASAMSSRVTRQTGHCRRPSSGCFC